MLLCWIFQIITELCLFILFWGYLTVCTYPPPPPPIGCAAGNKQITPFYGWADAGYLRRSGFLSVIQVQVELNCFVWLQQSRPRVDLGPTLVALTCWQRLAPSLPLPAPCKEEEEDTCGGVVGALCQEPLHPAVNYSIPEITLICARVVQWSKSCVHPQPPYLPPPPAPRALLWLQTVCPPWGNPVSYRSSPFCFVLCLPSAVREKLLVKLHFYMLRCVKATHKVC